MIKVVDKFISEIKDQVKEKGIRIKVNADAIEQLIEKGFDKKMGARPLQRVIDKEIKRPLAKMMLFGELKSGGAVVVSVDNGNIVLIPKIKTVKVVKHEITQDS
jgi:ATP-dependent Clp protease ATP-binding subunit ClpA